ncbi:energy-coupling factor transporter ATPase, partial [Christensenellaceae bacterium OttesenSCG-928-M15]|nr:energy-coupling factor transporter ATPase [Christensenellaceae bacterium OttesenSCG-928-M15]
ENVSLKIQPGEMLAIVGHNGSGKSTLAKLLNGLLIPSSGAVLVDGMETTDQERLLSIRQRVGMVFQNPDNQLVTTIVEEDVAFGPESLGVAPDEIRSRVDDALDAVNMGDYKQSAPHMLSGGQKQRVAIAGMLAMQPEVLVLDEATSMLDPEGRKDVFAVIRRLNDELNMTVIIITQLMEEATLCDRVAVMSQGGLMMLDTPKNVFRQREKLKSFGLDVPNMVAIRDDLILGGLPIQGDPLTAEELADAIVKSLDSAKGGE